MMNRKYITGFTLIEMAVVLVIVGILLGSFIGTLSGRIDTTRKSDALDELEEVKLAMVGFAIVNNRLPCPDCDQATGNCTAAMVGDGIEDLTGAICSENEGLGNVPWATLGLGASDPWGTRYRYSVQNEYTNNTVLFSLSSAAGSTTVEEPDFSVITVPAGADSKDLANNVVAILFSHGKNGFGGISVDNVAREAIPAVNIDELKNTDEDAGFNYYMRPETTAESTIAGKEFDDIVIWISEYELKAKMVEAGKLP